MQDPCKIHIYKHTYINICRAQDPNKSWGLIPEYSSCTLQDTWPQITEKLRVDPQCMTTGGLGRLMERGHFEIWVCERDNECSTPDLDGLVVPFCFVYNEVSQVFVPWDNAAHLGLSQACSAGRRAQGRHNMRTWQWRKHALSPYVSKELLEFSFSFYCKLLDGSLTSSLWAEFALECYPDLGICMNQAVCY